ncbi:MAG: hydrogenase maturation protease [Candidatus Aminicenantes bacterium]|nr:hydrogenase maturation protease [Candidatus Aminicenantes bacterium]
MKTLLIGIGNPGRRDDGLGPALVERLSGSRSPERAIVKTAEGSADAFWAYQLNVEDASLVREYDRIIFVDAAVEGTAPAALNPLEPAASIAFTTHEMSPASVLALGEELYGPMPEGFLLSIRGFSWDIAEGLTDEAARNLDAARLILDKFLQTILR